MYVTNTGARNQMYFGDGAAKFVEQKSSPAVNTTYSSLGAVAADLSGDGSVDIYVVNKDDHNEMFLNDGKGNFVAVADGVALGAKVSSRDVVAADLNGDNYTYDPIPS